MKNIFCLAFALISFSGMAHEIEGTLVLKGTLKTKINVEGIETTCKAKIHDVKNLMDQDSYGNPAYKIRMSISLSGRSEVRRVKYNNTSYLNNLFLEGKRSIVKDLDYASPEGITMRIDETGRMRSVQFTYNKRRINCNF